jgi:hypothetical protein
MTARKPKKVQSKPVGNGAPVSQVSVRMYRHGLGDCFLLRLPKDGGGTFNILIDCGLISVAEKPKETMQGVVADIQEACKGRLDLVVVTHEHWDHVSGFSSQQAQDAFDEFEISEVWYAWTEDPKSRLGKKLRAERESKLRALNRAITALRGMNTPLAVRRADRVASLLQFFGGEEPELLGAAGKASQPGKSRLAFDYPGTRRGIRLRYCYPNDAPETFPGVSGVRAYVLGPPQDEGMIKRSAPTKKGQEVYEFAGDLAIADNLSAAFERMRTAGSGAGTDNRDCPFDQSYARPLQSGSPLWSIALQDLIASRWNEQQERWRQIEEDWTTAAESLALNLDSHTNNTCLVLAFELVASGQVLLFAADAQVGNWLSWQQTKWSLKDEHGEREVTGPDLLKRTVFYKVGHHGSHNATLRDLGLEQMISGDLVAFVPVFKAQAEKNRWHAMPFQPLVKRLREKTRGRLVMSDPQIEVPAGEDLAGLTEAQGRDFGARLKAGPNNSYYEYTFDL